MKILKRTCEISRIGLQVGQLGWAIDTTQIQSILKPDQQIELNPNLCLFRLKLTDFFLKKLYNNNNFNFLNNFKFFNIDPFSFILEQVKDIAMQTIVQFDYLIIS